MVRNEIVVAVRPTPADETETREVSESLTVHTSEIERQLRSWGDEHLPTTKCGALYTVRARCGECDFAQGVREPRALIVEMRETGYVAWESRHEQHRRPVVRQRQKLLERGGRYVLGARHYDYSIVAATGMEAPTRYRNVRSELAVGHEIEAISGSPEKCRDVANRLAVKPSWILDGEVHAHAIGVMPVVPNWPVQQDVVARPARL